jgi:hypothetical protein
MRLSVQDNRLYVGWSSDGLRVVDITDPAQPRDIGHFNPPPQPVNGSTPISGISEAIPQNGLILASGTDGLWILRDLPR